MSSVRISFQTLAICSPKPTSCCEPGNILPQSATDSMWQVACLSVTDSFLTLPFHRPSFYFVWEGSCTAHYCTLCGRRAGLSCASSMSSARFGVVTGWCKRVREERMSKTSATAFCVLVCLFTLVHLTVSEYEPPINIALSSSPTAITILTFSFSAYWRCGNENQSSWSLHLFKSVGMQLNEWFSCLTRLQATFY
jgi:hypothetical protein